jgi:protein ImuA
MSGAPKDLGESLGKDPAVLAALRCQIKAIECDGVVSAGLSFGGEPIARALPPTGLAQAAVHEIAGGDGAVQGFAAALAGKLAGQQGMVLWVAREADIYAAALAGFGCDPARLIVARASLRADLLAVCEDGLRGSGKPGQGFSVVIADLPPIDLIAARRLQLAAAQGGATGLLIRPQRPWAAPGVAEVPTGAGSIAVTRWRVMAAPSGVHPLAGVYPLAAETAVGAARWRVELLRARGGIPGNWIMEWNDATRDFAVVAELLDRPAQPFGPDGREWRQIA